MDIDSLCNFATEIAIEAGKILKEGFGTLFKISNKEGKHNLLTEYDLLSETFLINKILEKYPNHSILSEEKGSIDKEASYLWIIDPLDGTVNFAHNIPFFSVSIGILKEGKELFGVVYNPIHEELFVGRKNHGAFFNQNKIKVSATEKLDNAILATGFPYNLKEDPFYCIERFSKVLHRGIPVRRIGVASLDLCYVAAGRFDGFWEVGLKPWDCAAGKLIIEEANGKVTDWKMQEYAILGNTPIMVSNTKLHRQIYEALS